MEDFSFADLLRQAEQVGFSALPAGEYDTQVVSAEARRTGTGKNKIAVRFQVNGGPHNGRSIFNDFVLSPQNTNAMVIFFRQMSAMGLNTEYFAGNPSLDKVAADLVNRKQRLKLGVRTWENVERNSVLSIMPAREGSVPGGFQGFMSSPVSPVPAPSHVHAPAPAPVPAPAPAPASSAAPPPPPPPPAAAPVPPPPPPAPAAAPAPPEPAEEVTEIIEVIQETSPGPEAPPGLPF